MEFPNKTKQLRQTMRQKLFGAASVRTLRNESGLRGMSTAFLKDHDPVALFIRRLRSPPNRRRAKKLGNRCLKERQSHSA